MTNVFLAVCVCVCLAEQDQGPSRLLFVNRGEMPDGHLGSGGRTGGLELLVYEALSY